MSNVNQSANNTKVTRLVHEMSDNGRWNLIDELRGPALASVSVAGDADVGSWRFGVLGPVAVRLDREAAGIAAAKHRAVLAVLLVRPGRQVSVDALVDALWGEEPPDTARKAVHGYVWRLRRVLGAAAARLVTTESGYRLVVTPDEVDVGRFDRLVAQARGEIRDGRDDRAVRTLTDALSLWRGPAFADVPRTPTVEAYAARLEEVRLQTLERLVGIQLALGRYEEALPDLVEWSAAHPYRESLQRLLMTALYRSGRRIDALAVYTGLRRALVSDYGMDPEAETVRLNESILRDSVEGW